MSAFNVRVNGAIVKVRLGATMAVGQHPVERSNQRPCLTRLLEATH
jgi:hypothetical protein